MLPTHIKGVSSLPGLLRFICYLPWDHLMDTPNHDEANFLIFLKSVRLILRSYHRYFILPPIRMVVYTCT